MLLELLLPLLKVPNSDLNLFLLQFFLTVLFALALIYIVRITASNYFVIDANFDSSSFVTTKINGDSPSPKSEMALPGAIIPCVVCNKPTTKHCSSCKLVRYCSEACQRSHWNSEHKKTCKSFKISSKADLKQTGSVTRMKKPFTGGRLILSRSSSENLNDPNKVLFSYEEFVQFFNWKKPGNPPCGLLNCGNSCFANVVLQCLACTRPLVAYLLEKGHQRECWRNEWCFMCELQSHVARATQTLQPFSPLAILSRLPNIGGNLGYGKQEDAHEFMRFAIDTMQSVCLDEFGGEKAVHPRAQETTLIQHIFGGHLQSQVMCAKCGNVSNQFENMMDLTVEMQGDAASLEECLDQFTIEERLHGDNMYKCDGCNDYVPAWKRLTIRRAPNILTIALKRFQSGMFGKLNKRVSFPETLDLGPYMSEAGDDGDVYKLYAVVVHVDMLNASYFGHYICYTKDFSGGWYRIDDCKVYRVELEEVLSQGAYMLLYSRVCVRMSCLNALESARKYGEEKLEVAQEAVPSAKQPVEGLSVVDSTDVPLVSGFFLSDTISQQMNSGCEDTKDVQLVDSEGHILEASSSTIREPNLKEPELPFPGSNVENKDVDDECCAKQHHVISSSDNNIEPHSNGVCGNGVAARDDAFASLCTGEVLNESHPYSSGGKTEMVKESGKGMPPSHIIDVGADKYDGEVINESHPYSSGGKTEMVKESGKGMPPSHIIDVGADKYDGRKSSGSKPKPLFDPGFLQNCPLKKYSEEVKSPVLIGQLTSVCNFHGENNRFIDTDLSIQNESGIRGGGPYILSDFSGKQTANSEDGIQMVTSKFSDSNIPQMRSSGFPHMPCDSLDIGNNSSSGEESIPVGNSCASSSTTAVVLNEPNCFISEVKQKKLEVEKGSLSLLVTEDVSAGEKDGRKYSGSKPLFRPGFLGKHPRESIQRKKQ